MNFEDAIKSEPYSENEFLWHPKSVWNQGLGVYGGLTFATILRTVASVTDRPIRRLSAELCAPISDQVATLVVHSKRRGGKTEFVSVEIQQDESWVALAHVTCGLDRSTDLDRKPRRNLPPRTGRPIGNDIPMPPFTQFFEFEPSRGQIPMSGCTDEVLKSGGWITPRFEAKRDRALVAAVMDAWWPAALAAARGPRPMGTISFAMDFLESPTEEPGSFYLEVSTAHMAEGYSIEVNELWDHEGRYLGRAQQNIALIR